MSVEDLYRDTTINFRNSNMRLNSPTLSTKARAVAVVMLMSTLTFAQTDDLRLPMLLDADSTDYDGKSSMLMFRGLRLTQGSLGIAADEGRASKMDFEDSVWHFAGNVVIDVANGHIECDSADISFSGYQLRIATIAGSPATFRMARPDSEQITYAEAGRLNYDFEAGVVEFSGNATITEGGNQIASNYLVYNIQEQRINASSGGAGEPRVRITYTPGEIDALEPSLDTPGAPEDEPPAQVEVPEGNGEPG